MTGFVVDIELSLTVDELMKLKQLSEHKKSSVEQVARDCMMAKCTEELQEELFERVDKKCNVIRENTERKQLAKLGKEMCSLPDRECGNPAAHFEGECTKTSNKKEA